MDRTRGSGRRHGAGSPPLGHRTGCQPARRPSRDAGLVCALPERTPIRNQSSSGGPGVGERARGLCYSGRTTFHRLAKWARSAHFLREESPLVDVYDRKRTLAREIAQTVERASGRRGARGRAERARTLHGLRRPSAWCRPRTLRARHDLLRGYLDRFTVDVSSPGLERPLRTPTTSRAFVGRRVAIRTRGDIGGRKRFRGELRLGRRPRIHRARR